MALTVDELIKWPFLNRPREDRINILKQGKPRPSLPFLQTKPNNNTAIQQGLYDNNDKCLIVFDPTSYDHVEWLTGCSVRQALFCWPCLLFRIVADGWNRKGITDLNDLRRKIDMHAKCISHIQSDLEMKLFHPPEEIIPERVPEELIKRNREIARRTIDTICALVAESHPKEHGYRNRVRSKDFIENMQFIREYDFVQTSIIDDTAELLKTSPKLFVDMVKAINDIVKSSFQAELQQSTFVSLILSEHSREPGKSKISVVARYLKRGEVCERFIECIDTNGEKTCSLICDHMSRVIRDFQLSQNLLAFSLDGSVYPDLDSFSQYVDQVRGKEDEILSCCQQHVTFIPSHFHRLDQVLQQCLSVHQVCDIFYKNLEAVRSYFPKGSKIRALFRNFIALDRNPGVPEPDLDAFDSKDCLQVLMTLKMHRVDFIRFFHYKLETYKNWTEGEIAKIRGFCAYLKDFATFFLLDILTRLFSLLSPLEEALYSDSSVRIPDSRLVEGVYKSLFNGEKVNTYWSREHFEKEFDAIYQSVVQSYKEIENAKPKQVSEGLGNECFYRTLYANILRVFVSQVQYRYLKQGKIGLFNVSNLKKKGERLNTSYLKKVTLAYPTCFDYAKLEEEIESLEKDETILNCASVHEMMEVFLKRGHVSFCVNLSRTRKCFRTCPNLYTLLELVLTLPCSLPNLKGGPSKLAELTRYYDTSDERENLGDISLLCIELDHLIEQKKRFSFHEEVMNRFQEINASLPLSNT